MLNPLLLLFLPLALVPLLLHLITLRRLRTVEMSTFRFLMDSYVQQRRKLKLLEWLLMLLRTAFVALIVLTLARPVLSKFGALFGGATGREVAIVIDSGATMAARTGGLSSFERGKKTARKVIELLGRDDHVTIIRAGDRAEVLRSQFAGNPAPLLEAVDKLELGAAGSDMAAGVAQAFASGRHGQRVAYVISDCNARAWRGLGGHEVVSRIDKESKLVVMNVGPTEPVVNLGVVGDPPRSLRAIAGLPVLLSTTVANSSRDTPADTVLSVLLDDEQVTQFNLSMQPGEKVTRALTVTPSKPGIVRGRFELPADGFTDDDAYLFCLNVEPVLNVLIVTGPLGPKPGDQPALYIRSALRSPLESRAGVSQEDKSLASALSITEMPQEQVNQQALDAADVVVLADANLDAARGAMLRQYAEGGGGILVMPGPNVNAEYYQAHLLRDQSAPGADFPVCILDPAVGDPDNEAMFTSLAAPDVNHPVLAAFSQHRAQSKPAYFATARLYRYFPLRQPSGSPDAAVGAAESPARHPFAVLMSTTDRRPLMIETRIGEGRVLVAGFSASPEWSNLPLKPEFVPMLLRAVAHLRRPAAADAPPSVDPHQPATVRVTDRWPQATVQALDPAGKPHTIEMHRAGRRFIGALNETDRKGYYSFVVHPRAQGAPERVELGLAVNVDTGDADFRTLDEAGVQALLDPAPMIYLQGSPDDPLLGEQLKEKREIWRTLIWVMFAVIALEFLLATLRPPGDPVKTDGPPLTRVQRWRGRVTALISGEKVSA